MNNTTIISNSVLTVPFHNAELYVIEHNDAPYVPMKPIVQGMGLDWKGQHAKLKNGRFNSVMEEISITAADGKNYQTSCLPLRKFPGWLMSIHPNKVKPQHREAIILYQNECDDVLWDYWNKGVALNPRAFKQGKDDILSVDESNILRNMIEKDAKMLFPDDKEKQGKFLRQGWSKLKSHFGVTYKQIPKHELTTAISILQRHGLEWQEAEPEFNVPMSHSNGAKHLKEFFQKCIDDVRKGGSYTDKQYIPLDVLKGFVLSQMNRFKMMTCFDSDSMTLQHYLIKEGSVMFDPADEKQVRGMISEGIPKSFYPMIIGTIMNYFNEIDQERRRQITHKQRLVTA